MHFYLTHIDLQLISLICYILNQLIRNICLFIPMSIPFVSHFATHLYSFNGNDRHLEGKEYFIPFQNHLPGRIGEAGGW